MSATKLERYQFTAEVFKYIRSQPMCSRAELNSIFKVSSNDRAALALTDALASLLHFGYVHKHLDTGSSTQFYWDSSYEDSPYAADLIGSLTTNEPINVMDTAHMESSAPEEGTKAELPPSDYPSTHSDHYTPAEKAQQAMLEKLHGGLRKLYEVLMQAPDALLAKNDARFVASIPDAKTRAQNLGRLWSIGAIRRGSDKDSLFYTLTGVFPSNLSEDNRALSKAAQRRLAEVAERAERQRKIIELKARPKVDSITPESEEETVEETETLVEPEVAEEHEPVDTDPEAFMNGKGNFMMLRSDGSTIYFDEAESSAWRQLITKLKISTLERNENALPA
jgi:hypothetical protein